MHELEKTKLELEADPSKREALFNEMVQMCLWGNATVSGDLPAHLQFTELGFTTRAGSVSPHPYDGRGHPEPPDRREGGSGRQVEVHLER